MREPRDVFNPEIVDAIEAEGWLVVPAGDQPPPTADDVQNAVRLLALRTVDEISKMLSTGTPALKQKLLSQMFARLLPLMADKDEDNLGVLREQMMSMLRDARAAKTDLPVDLPDIPEDV